MGFFFRKSNKIGPFRINFSKSGIGVSAGVKGARISKGPRGTYVNFGAKGIYYRKKIDSIERSELKPDAENTPIHQDLEHTITSQNFDNLSDADSAEFVKELEEKINKVSFFKWAGWIPSLILFLILPGIINPIIDKVEKYETNVKLSADRVNIRSAPDKKSAILKTAQINSSYRLVDSTNNKWYHITISDSTQGYVFKNLATTETILTGSTEIRKFDDNPGIFSAIFLVILIGLISWCIYMYRVDKRRKSINIFYELDEEVKILHDKFLEYFNEFRRVNKKWQFLHSTTSIDSKYNAGASSLVNRIAVPNTLNNKKPVKFLKTNVTIPYIGLKNTEMYFFPERLILKRGKKLAAVFYKNMDIDISNTQFIESGAVPGDATVIDRTWKYVNKSGGPDKRFSDNKELPVCQYSIYHFISENGLNEIICTSKVGGMDSFARFILKVKALQKELEVI